MEDINKYANSCENLVGKIFKYNNSLSKMTKIEFQNNIQYQRNYCDYFGNIEFGAGVTGNGVTYFGNQLVGIGTNTISIVDTIDNIKQHFIDLGIEPKWYIVDKHCATLIKLNGNPENIEDRVAFIEKTPRILVNNEWIEGPKGDGELLGFYPESREWIQYQLLQIKDLNNDNELKNDFER